MRRFTHLGRIFSLTYPPNRALLALVVVGAVGGWINPAGNTPAGAMFQAAATVAVTWLLIQELDPDRPWIGLWGTAAAGASAVLTGEADVAALVSLMLAGRILVRSTGLVPLLTDIVAVGLFAGVFARTPMAWAAGLAVASAVALDTNHHQPSPVRHTWLALAIGVAVTISAVFSGALDLRWTTPGWFTGILAVAAIALSLTAPTAPDARNDVGEPFDPGRVRTTRLLVLGAVTLGTLAGGGAHSAATWPIWIALVTAGVIAHLRR